VEEIQGKAKRFSQAAIFRKVKVSRVKWTIR